MDDSELEAQRLHDQRRAELDAAVAQARLEEAEWWEHVSGLDPHYKESDKCQEDCPYCERIAVLKAAAGRKS